MAALYKLIATPGRRIACLAGVIFALDQITKQIVLRTIPISDEHTVIPGFFNLAHRANTGAAWSLFTGNNAVLAFVAIAALVALVFTRQHFKAGTPAGQIAFGLIFGGICGNLADRLCRGAVVDFLHFYLQRRGSFETFDFPAFNVADSAICTGVGLIFLVTWKNEVNPVSAPPPKTSP